MPVRVTTWVNPEVLTLNEVSQRSQSQGHRDKADCSCQELQKMRERSDHSVVKEFSLGVIKTGQN